MQKWRTCRTINMTCSIWVVVCAGCVSSDEHRKKLDLGVAPTMGPLADSASYRDTIGSHAYFEGLRPMRVRGYGLVVGLGKNGSSDCPRDVFGQLVQRMYKSRPSSASRLGEKRLSPEAMIRDLDTAVVIVEGAIPAAAVKGARFDVGVMALPGTQVTSLRGGRLYTTDLQVFRPVGRRKSIMGQNLAYARGPLFVNPFSQGDAATQADPLRATVVGGGVATKDRRIRLVLQTPSYRISKQIQDCLNGHFHGRQRIADATSPSFVQLHLPEEYHDQPAHFLGLVRALYVARDPQFQAARARTLVQEMTQPGAPLARIALAFEGLGRTALPVLESLYTHHDDSVSFYAAAAGLRIGDPVAADTLGVHAADSRCEHRFKAIRALGQAHGMAGAALSLRTLLHNDDPRVAVAAYEALLPRNDPSVHSVSIGSGNFKLDHVFAKRDNLIYVKRSGSRRIALIGEDLRIMPPVIYRSPEGSITINALEGDDTVTVLRLVVATGSMAPPVDAPLEIPKLIRLLGSKAEVNLRGEVLGLGLDYTTIVRALYHLCEDKSINAAFVLEEPNATELFGPTRPAGRPESESQSPGR